MSKEPKTQPQWLGRPIAEESHVHDLEQAAAMNEFGKKMPREQAEEAAHQNYTKELHAKAAAHHLCGMKGAHAAGDMGEARKHSILYDLHLKKIGHDSGGPVPDVVKQHLSPSEEPRVYKFKPHKADLMVLQGAPAGSAETQKSESDVEARLADILRACRFVVTAESLLK